MSAALQILQYLTYLFVLAVGVAVFVVLVMFVIDVTQTKHAVRRNFPVIGRFRYLFERLGEFFRNTFSRWTERNCHLTVPSAPGFIVPRRASTTRWLLAPRATCVLRAQ